MSKPNILLAVVDCLRADFVQEPGHARIPTLDRLRREGFTFRNAIAGSTTTTPSFSSILTGRYPFEHGVRSHSGTRLDDRVQTLAELMRAAGYHTYAEVSGPLGTEIGLARGFESYHHRGKRQTVHTAFGEELLAKFQREFQPPWFVLLHIWALHRPRGVVPECRGREFGATEYGRALSSIDRYLERLFPALPPDTVTLLTGDHGEEITTGPWDSFLKKFRRKMYKFRKKRGLTREHVSHGLRFISDGHGYSLYDVLIRVPFILHGPGRIPHGESEKQVRHIDIAPTLLDTAGAPAALTGESVLPIVRGEPGRHRDAYLEAVGVVMPDRNEWLSGLRVDNRYKYICAPFCPSFAPELFDLEADPGERRSIAAERPEVVADLRARIEALDPYRESGKSLGSEEQAAVISRLKDLGYVD